MRAAARVKGRGSGDGSRRARLQRAGGDGSDAAIGAAADHFTSMATIKAWPRSNPYKWFEWFRCLT